MKTRFTSSCTSSPSKKEEASFYRYLKPGALAQIRDSKFTAKSRKPNSQNLIALQLINLSSREYTSQSLTTQIPMDKIPSFASRIGQARCISRKKLLAVAPIFADIQS